MLEVREARTAREIDAFLRLGPELHAGDPIYVPPLEQDLARALSPENPLWRGGRGERALLVAFDGEVPVGRVLAHVHHASNALHGEHAGFFGLVECPDDPAVARALFDAAAERHRARGLRELRGPYELTVRECIGAVTEGFDEPPTFGQSWNAPHLPRLLEGLGFAPVYRAATWRLDDLAAVDPGALLGDKQRAWLERPGVTLRAFSLDRFEEDLAAAIEILNASFAGNYGFVPMSREEVAFVAKPMKRVVRPELTVFLELAGKPVGVGMTLPDFNLLFRRMEGSLWPLGWARFLAGAKRLDGAVVQFIGTSPELQNQGLMRVVVSEIVRRAQQAGLRTLDGTWIGEQNAKSQAQAKAAGMRRKHALALYAKAL